MHISISCNRTFLSPDSDHPQLDRRQLSPERYLRLTCSTHIPQLCSLLLGSTLLSMLVTVQGLRGAALNDRSKSSSLVTFAFPVLRPDGTAVKIPHMSEARGKES